MIENRDLEIYRPLIDNGMNVYITSIVNGKGAYYEVTINKDTDVLETHFKTRSGSKLLQPCIIV